MAYKVNELPIELLSEWNDWTSEFLAENSVSARKVNLYRNTDNELCPLCEHIFKDGHRVTEYVQYERDFGDNLRVVLIALKENGQPIPQSLWLEKFIRETEELIAKQLTA